MRVTRISLGSTKKASSNVPVMKLGLSTRLTTSARRAEGSFSAINSAGILPPTAAAASHTPSRITLVRCATSGMIPAFSRTDLYSSALETEYASELTPSSRMPWVSRDDWMPARENVTSFSPYSAVIHRTGRENKKLDPSHRIDLPNEIPATTSFISCGSTVVAACPLSTTFAKMYSTFFAPSSRTTTSATSTPSPRQKPSAAFVGFPSLNARAAGGPRASRATSGCLPRTPEMQTATRRGVA
mmetsp:Transcript_26507/g.66432  ORF Transcript_26507/g.66432 Transcript_26507/m.66432 type:complete len:243 (-) Transcript_26507:604-1332(-)